MCSLETPRYTTSAICHLAKVRNHYHKQSMRAENLLSKSKSVYEVQVRMIKKTAANRTWTPTFLSGYLLTSDIEATGHWRKSNVGRVSFTCEIYSAALVLADTNYENWQLVRSHINERLITPIKPNFAEEIILKRYVSYTFCVWPKFACFYPEKKI